VVIEDLVDFRVSLVFKEGKLVAEDGKPLFDRVKKQKNPPVSMKLKNPGTESLRIPWNDEEARVIRLIPNQILTDELSHLLKREGEYAVSDTENDILKIAVFERHRGTGNCGIGFVNGFGIKRGAIGSSVGHDSHNIIVVGTSDDDIITTLKRIEALRGGQVVVADGEVISELPLPVAGLMSDSPLEEVEAKIEENLAAARSVGCTVEDPFMTLSFLPLPVIPKLKITDKGLVDVTTFSIVPLYYT
jgi:adenine deaminase